MSTIQETLLPAAMVPGLVTIKDKKGQMQNVYPIDAKELLASGDFELVENGAIEAARMAATPLRSGMASGIPSENIIAEVAGIEGRIVASSDPKEVERIKSETAGIDGTGPDENAPKSNAGTQRTANELRGSTQVKPELGEKPGEKPGEKSGNAGGDKGAADKK